MFSKHVAEDLSAYCHGELQPEESRAVAEHLIACNNCRVHFEEIKLGVKLAERLPQLSAPDSIWERLQSQLDAVNKDGPGLAGIRSSISNPKSEVRNPKFRSRFAAVAAGLLIVAGIGSIWFYSRESRPFWEVARIDGMPVIGTTRLAGKGRLAVGQWLETDNASRAKIDVGTIGEVDIDPNTRVRLVETRPTEHRLELERGRLSARIWAPPRLFFVDTPSAVVADLGCAYTLEVDNEGGGILHVTSGWVALQLRDRESMVPVGAACATRKGIGPGTPYFEDASFIFRSALTKLDFEPEDPSASKIQLLDQVLLEARPRDSLTLWHLLRRVEGKDRERVYDRLALLAPPPGGVTRDGILQLDKQMLERWQDNLEGTWSGASSLKRGWIKIWTHALGRIKGQQSKK